MMVFKRVKIQPSILLSVFLMLYVSPDTLFFGTNGNGSAKLMGYAVMLLLTLYWLLKGKVSKTHMSVSIALIFFGMLTMFTTGFNIKYFYVFMLIILASFFCTSVKFEVFLEAYQKIMLFLSLYSFVSFLLCELTPTLISRFPVVVNEAGLRFYNLIFDFSLVKMMYVTHRSFGIFREPGVYMFFLSIAMIFELFFVKENSKKRMLIHVVIYIAAMIVTLSSAGYIILTLVLMLYLLFGTKRTENKNLKNIVFIICVGFMLWLYFDEALFDEVFGKLSSDNYSKTSRLESITTNIRMIASNIEHFFTGLGFSFVEGNFRYFSTDAATGDNTNTIFRIFSTYGFMYISVLIALWFSFFSKVKNKSLSISLFGVFCLCLFNESLIVNIILYIIAFYSLNEKFVVHKPQEQRLTGSSKST